MSEAKWCWVGSTSDGQPPLRPLKPLSSDACRMKPVAARERGITNL
jgi:hypothetical protein